MDEDEIWLSEEEDEEEEYMRPSTDPKSFNLALTYQGQPGGKHVATVAFIFIGPFSPDRLGTNIHYQTSMSAIGQANDSGGQFQSFKGDRKGSLPSQ